MKHLFASSLLLVSPLAHAQQAKPMPAQPINPASHLVTYMAVVEVPGATQAQRYARAEKWVSQHFTEVNPAGKSEALGRLVVRGVVYPPSSKGFSSTVTYTLGLYARGNTYKYMFTDFRHESLAGDATGFGAFEKEQVAPGPNAAATQRAWNAIRTETGEQIQALIASLNKAMK